ncbi:MAG: chemotaxis protein CheW [Desulfuromonadales bacterium]
MLERTTKNAQFLTFRLGTETFAIEVKKTREILDYSEPVEVPRMPAELLGVINLRGKVVPVVDLRRKFGMPAAEITEDNCIIILEVTIAGETAVVGALADSVREVLSLPPEQIEPPPKMGTRLKTEFIRGMGKQEDEFMIILDVDRVFSTDELDLLQQTLESAQSPAENA